MNKSLLPVNGNTILDQGQFEFWTTTEHGIEFADNTPREAWRGAMKQLLEMWESSGRLNCRATFCLADACNAGEKLFGEEYAQAIDNTRKFIRLQTKTISNLMWIAKKVAPTRRREVLSLTHHEIVASLPDDEQESFLALAEKDGLNTKELKEKVREAHPSKPRSTKSKQTKSSKLKITDARTAKDAATQLSNWLTENEDKLNDSWKPLLEHMHKLYRRKWQSGHKR
jgi:hypothetical protein